MALNSIYAHIGREHEKGHGVALECAEENWRQCHRMIVAKKLMEVFCVETRHNRRNAAVETQDKKNPIPKWIVQEETGEHKRKSAKRRTLRYSDHPEYVGGNAGWVESQTTREEGGYAGGAPLPWDNDRWERN